MIKELYDTVCILNKLNFKIQDSALTLMEICNASSEEEIKIQKLTTYIMDLGMINSVSYLKEIEDYFLPSVKHHKGDECFNYLKKILNVPKKRINKSYPDLELFRNNYLAHNMRINKAQFKNVIIDGDLRKYRIPQNFFDYVFLISCIDLIHINIKKKFDNELEKAELIWAKSVESIPLINPQFLNNDSIMRDLKSLSILMENERTNINQ
jgi:hypothetical protein